MVKFIFEKLFLKIA